MKVKNLIFKVYILIIPVLMCVLGCQDPILVGSDILDDEKINIEVVHNFDLSTKTVPGERLVTHRLPTSFDPRFYRLGEIKNFTGIDSPYEEPENPEIIIETGKLTIEESVEKIINFLRSKTII